MDIQKIKAIFFDLGDTLLNFGKIKTSQLFQQAGKQTYEFLKKARQPVGPYQLYFWRNLVGLRLKYLISCINGKDFDSLKVLKESGQKRGYQLSEEQWIEYNWLWYQPGFACSWVEPDICRTLTAISEAGFKLGIISNTFVHRSALDRHLKMAEILDFFPLRIYSYEHPRRKPHKSIFLQAAEVIGEKPGNIIYVGDRIDNDIKGSMNAGMVPILKKTCSNQRKAVPDGVVKIEKLSDLLDILNINGNVSQDDSLHQTVTG